jgi:hypothetical protein
MQAQLIGDLRGIHGIRQILLVGEDKEQRIPQLILVEHALQLLAGLDDTVAIVAVDDEDDALRVLEVVAPQRPDLVLAADVPDGELNVLVFDCFDVEACAVVLSAWVCFVWVGVGGGCTNGRDGGDDFAQLQLVQDGSLSSRIQADHQDTHLLLAPEAIEQLRECETHGGGVAWESVWCGVVMEGMCRGINKWCLGLC